MEEGPTPAATQRPEARSLARLAFRTGLTSVVNETVPDAAFGQNVGRIGRISFELLAEIVDIEPKVVRLIAVFVPPDLGEQLFVGDHPACVLDKVVEKAELSGAELDQLVVDPYLPSVEVNPQALIDTDGLVDRRGGRLGATENGLYAADHLPWAEGLGDVVVGAELKAPNTVILLALGGEHDDGHTRDLADKTQRVEPVQIGHHDIQENQVGQVVLELLQGARARIRVQNLEPVVLEVQTDEVDNAGLVIDDQNPSALQGGHLTHARAR